MTDCKHKLVEFINKSYLPKLARGVDECESHYEYEMRNKTLPRNAQQIALLFKEINFKTNEDIINRAVSKLVILSHELQSDGPWTTDTCRDIAKKLNRAFNLLCGTTLDKLLSNKEPFNVQIIFDMCMQMMHENINHDSLKKYPALADAYCSIVTKIPEYNVVIIPSKILPISLLLIDDYLNENRMKGLNCCMKTLECLRKEDFMNGNYYEVIYASLKKVMYEKDLEVTRSVMKCTLQLIKKLPEDAKIAKTDEFYENTLDQLITESNLHRKVILFEAVKNVIEIHNINCVKHGSFKDIICDNLDICSNSAVAEMLLQVVLECFQEWLKYCWPIWRLSSDQQVLSSLFKTLHLCEDKHVLLVQNLIIALVKLCTKEEQIQINANLEKPDIPHEKFTKRLDMIKKKIQM